MKWNIKFEVKESWKWRKEVGVGKKFESQNKKVESEKKVRIKKKMYLKRNVESE